MSKHNLKIIIEQIQNSPTMKMMREMRDSPAMKMMREIQDSPAAKMMREMQDSPAMKMMREMQDSPAMKMMREMQDSPAMKMMREIQDSPAAKMMREIQDSPAAKMMREMQDSPAMKMMREIQRFKHSTKLDVIEEIISISDEAFGTQNLLLNEQLNAESLFINTVFIAIYVLLINAQVPFDQFIVTLAQNFLNSALFFYLQSKYEISRKCPNSINKNDLRSSRVTIKDESLYLEPKINSEIIENLETYKFLRILEEPNLHKSWLKVQVEINNEILEGYVLRRYTSPIK